MDSESLFCARWMRNTIKKVTIVVPVLMTSCHVSEKPKIGPVTSQTRTTAAASAKPHELPVATLARRATCSSNFGLRAIVRLQKKTLEPACTIRNHGWGGWHNPGRGHA